MQTKLISTLKNAVLASIFLAVFSTNPLQAADAPKDKISEWITSCPYIGLVAKEVAYGPITLKNFNLEKKGRIVIAKPGETLDGTVRYEIDSDKLEDWNLHHIIVGIAGEDAQSCITHTVGVWDSKGKAKFNLVAPAKKGVYEVRFDYQNAILCSDAINAWKKDSPSSSATVGIVIVE